MEIDDIFEEKRKKGSKGKPKGKRKELNLVKLLNDRFSDYFLKNPDIGKFSRSIGSGNRWGQAVSLSQQAKQVFTGDLACPDGFRFTIENKGGYNDIDLYTALYKDCLPLDKFLKQTLNDSIRANKIPLLIWQKDRKKHLCFLPKQAYPEKPTLCLFYEDWIGLALDQFLSLDDNFFFKAD